MAEKLFTEKSAILTGHECWFVHKPPRRSECPVCLLVLREPHQATCCGKIFCKVCIYKIRDMERPCPTCKTESFSCYPDKGLQQDLYSCRVYCPEKTGGCDWEGELGDLDHHLNLNAEESRKVKGCGFVDVMCLYCCGLYQRCELSLHQSTECDKRPFTCEMCQEYESNYNDVVLVHAPTCKCRPVDCPNQCGSAVQHRELEQHLSNNCYLSEVECEFGHAGCEAKMTREDIPSHLSDNTVSHLSLLAAENRRLKSQLESNLRDVEKRVKTLEVSKHFMNNCLSRLTPFQIRYPWKEYAQLTMMGYQVVNTNAWFSEPFYSHFMGFKLRLKVWCTAQNIGFGTLNQIPSLSGIWMAYEVMDGEFQADSRYTIFVTTSIFDIGSAIPYVHKKIRVTNLGSENWKIPGLSMFKFLKKRDNIEISVEHTVVVYS